MSKKTSSWQEMHAQTGQVRWVELQRPFARGLVFRVSPELDLVVVASAMRDDAHKVLQSWLADGGLAAVDDVQARDWLQRDPLLWAVVVAPWVLVQERPLPELEA